MVWNLDAYCPKSHRPSCNTFLKVQTQNFKDFSCFEEFKPKDLKSAPLQDHIVEPAKKKGKTKKRSQRYKEKYISKWKEQFLATDVNTKALKKIKAKCFNYNKKGHYANNCTISPKN